MIPRSRWTVRDARPEDLPAVVAIYNASVPGRMATANPDPVTVEERRAWFEEHSPERRPLWVAEYDGQIVGWLSFQSFYGRPAYHATAELSLYVAPEHQGKGLGRFLTQEAIRRAPELGLKTLLAMVFAHNTPSLALLESLGFERWGLLPNVAELDGVQRSLVIMGKRVAP